jgi:hypothetical protein
LLASDGRFATAGDSDGEDALAGFAESRTVLVATAPLVPLLAQPAEASAVAITTVKPIFAHAAFISIAPVKSHFVPGELRVLSRA